MPAIVVEGLTKSYGDFLALDQATFSVSEGAFFGCFGPNGAGKSTLLAVLVGELEPDSGRVNRHPNARVALLGQEVPDWDPHRTAVEIGLRAYLGLSEASLRVREEKPSQSRTHRAEC